MATITREAGGALQTRPHSSWLGRVPGPPDLLLKLRPVFSTRNKAALNGYVISSAKESNPAIAEVRELPGCTIHEIEAPSVDVQPPLELSQNQTKSSAPSDVPAELKDGHGDLGSSSQTAKQHDTTTLDVATDAKCKPLAGTNDVHSHLPNPDDSRTEGAGSESDVVNCNPCENDPAPAHAEDVLVNQRRDIPENSAADTIEVINDRSSPVNAGSNAVAVQAGGPSPQVERGAVKSIDFATRNTDLLSATASSSVKSKSWRGSLRRKLWKTKDGSHQYKIVASLEARSTSVPDDDAIIFTEQVRPHVRALLRHKTAGLRNQLDDRTACELVMMYHASSSKRIPVILFTCYRLERQKQIQAALSKPALESLLAKFGYPAVVQMDESLGFRAKLTRTEDEHTITDGNGLLVFADIAPGAVTLTGVAVGIETHKNDGRGSHILSTCGGVVSVAGESYAITCSHALVEWLETESNLAEILGDGHNSRIQSDLSSSNFLDSAKWEPQELGKVAAFSSQKLDSDALDFDWLLIDVKENFILPNTVTEVWIPGTSNPSDRSCTVETCHGVLFGLVCAGRTMLDIGPATFDAVRIDLDSPLRDGDCGAWVLRKGKLFGVVVAGRDNPPTAYVLPANEVFDDISSVMGHCTLELPPSARQSSEPINRLPNNSEVVDQGSASNEQRDGILSDDYDESKDPDLETGLSSEAIAPRIQTFSEKSKIDLQEPESKKPPQSQDWSRKRRWLITTILALHTLLPAMAVTMVVPGLHVFSSDFSHSGFVLSQMIFSAFPLGNASGPLLFMPFSEVYGRWITLQLGFTLFGLSNLVSGFVKGDLGYLALIFIRLVSGIGGASSTFLCFTIVNDCLKPKERVTAYGVLGLVIMLGAAMGPIIGAFITQYVSWRWVYWSMAAAAGITQILGFFCVPETHAGLIVKRRDRRPRRKDWLENLRIERVTGDAVSQIFKTLTRMGSMLSTQPILQLTVVYMAFLTGVLDLILSTIPVLFASKEYYHETVGVAGLNYISIALGFFVGGCATGVWNRREGDKTKSPTLLMIPGAMFVPIGLFVYGWTAQTHQHWILPNLGLLLFSSAVTFMNTACQTCLIDSFTVYAWAAMGSCTVVRAIFGFSFPLFAPALYQNLGFGWGNSVLAFAAMAMGILYIVLLWAFGPKLRARSKYIASSSSLQETARRLDGTANTNQHTPEENKPSAASTGGMKLEYRMLFHMSC